MKKSLQNINTSFTKYCIENIIQTNFLTNKAIKEIKKIKNSNNIITEENMSKYGNGKSIKDIINITKLNEHVETDCGRNFRIIINNTFLRNPEFNVLDEELKKVTDDDEKLLLIKMSLFQSFQFKIYNTIIDYFNIIEVSRTLSSNNIIIHVKHIDNNDIILLYNTENDIIFRFNPMYRICITFTDLSDGSQFEIIEIQTCVFINYSKNSINISFNVFEIINTKFIIESFMNNKNIRNDSNKKILNLFLKKIKELNNNNNNNNIRSKRRLRLNIIPKHKKDKSPRTSKL